MAKTRLGRMLRNRREELGVKVKEIAKRLDWTTQFVGEIEKGTKSSDDVRAWIRLADALQLDRLKLLEQVWGIRSGMTLEIPPAGDPRRAVLLKLAIELYADGESDPV